MKCSNCGYENPDFSNFCTECGSDLRQQGDNSSKRDISNKNMDFERNKSKKPKSNPRSAANYILTLTVLLIVLFFLRVLNSGIDFGEMLSEVDIGAVSLMVLLATLFFSFIIYGLGIKLRINTFENSEKYPMNDFYLKISKIYSLGTTKTIPDSIGFFEVASMSLLNMFPVILLSTIATWNSVWGFPYKFIVELIFAIISIIIFVSFLLFPDKVNKLFKEDIRSEEGFKKYFIVSKIPLVLMILGIYIHIFL